MNELWIPGQGMELHGEYPVPPIEELKAHWQEYADGEVVAVPGLYGAMTLPNEPPRAYASVDVCEILRETCLGVRAAAGVDAAGYGKSTHNYREGTPFDDDYDVVSVVQVMMNNSLIRPKEGIEEMAAIMRGWRERGVYIAANTSTLPGCELSTIAFFQEYLPGIFQGLLLPRNHNGTLPLTKGHAAANVIAAVPPANGEVVAVHIDDTPHHNVAFRNQVGSIPGATVATFQPEYPSHLPPDLGSMRTSSPLEAFRAADQFFTGRLSA